MIGKPKISTSRRQILPDIDLRQTRFRIDSHLDLITINDKHKYFILKTVDALLTITTSRATIVFDFRSATNDDHL